MNPAIETVTTRANKMIDPHLHVWEWEIPVYLFLGGVVAGLMILTAALELLRGERPRSAVLRWIPLVSIILLSIGMLALFLDLEYKRHVYRFYTAFMPASPMSWGSWILLIVYPVALLHWVGSLPPKTRRLLFGPGEGRGLGRWLRRLCARIRILRRPILWTSIAAGIGLGIYTGLLLGTLNARPLWNTTILGPLFLLSGLSTGAAFMLLFRLEHVEHKTLARWDAVAISAELVFVVLLLLDLSTGSRAAQTAAKQLLGGEWTGVFWSLVVVAGLVVPLALKLVERRRRLVPTLFAPVLVLIGGFALRWILLMAGQESSFSTLLH